MRWTYLIIGLIILALVGLIIYYQSDGSESLPLESSSLPPVSSAPPVVPSTPLSFVITDPTNIKPNERQSFT